MLAPRIRFFRTASSFVLLAAFGHPVFAAAGDGTPEDALKDRAKSEDEGALDAAPSAAVDLKADDFWQTVTLLQSKVSANLSAGREALQKLAEQEYVHAQVLLGECLLSGSYGFAKDARKGANSFRLAAERGNAFAKVSLGSCYATGTGVKKDDEKAASWLLQALAADADFSRPPPPKIPVAPAATPDGGVAGELANDPVSGAQATAHLLLAQIFSRQKKNAEAQTHYVAAATAGVEGRSGIYAAAVRAAVNYAFGEGVPRDQAKANAMLEQSRRLTVRMNAKLIHNYVALKMVDEFAVADLEETATEAGENFQSQTQMQIAALLADKKSKTYDLAEAVKWYELAAENGQLWAMLPLAFIYWKGDLGRPDPQRAFHWFEQAGGGEKKKHVLGAANLGICYQNGIGTAKDPAKAAAIFEKLRDVDIVCYLGSIGRCPAAPVTYEEAAKLNETWAKQQNDPHAQYLLALRHLGGWGVAVDRAVAVSWLKKAVAANHGGALLHLGTLYESNPALLGETSTPKAIAAAAECYRKGGVAGNVDAWSNYANMLDAGKGVPRDAAKAVEIYRECLTRDPEHARSHNNLGAIYESRLRQPGATSENRELMLKHYEEAVRLKLPHAARNLATIYYEGVLVPRDFQKAYQYFEQAVELGFPLEHFHLGMMHEEGLGVPVTYTEAAYHYRLAALEGHRESLRRLVNFYIIGRGVSPDIERAVFWMEKMYAMGNTRVLSTLCDVLLGKKDYASALPLLRKLSDSKDPFLAGYGNDRLAICYAEGLGVKVNAGRSEKHFAAALKLKNGNALTRLGLEQIAAGKISEGVSALREAAPSSREASYALGQMYYLGTKVTKNESEGLRFLELSASLNHPDALIALAVLTYNRAPGSPPLERAIELAQQAENTGHPKGKFIREKLEAVRAATPPSK